MLINNNLTLSITRLVLLYFATRKIRWKCEILQYKIDYSAWMFHSSCIRGLIRLLCARVYVSFENAPSRDVKRWLKEIKLSVSHRVKINFDIPSNIKKPWYELYVQGKIAESKHFKNDKFWISKHGVKLTGMNGEQENWITWNGNS